MLQPQKRQDMKKALEACMGRMLEIRHWMVRVLIMIWSCRSRCGCYFPAGQIQHGNLGCLELELLRQAHMPQPLSTAECDCGCFMPAGEAQ
jgi:hypothetical protein